MDFEGITFSFEAVRWFVMAAIGIYAWIIGRQSASARELLELRTRLTALEVQVQQMPASQDVHEVSARLERIDARLDGVIENIQPIARSLDRINDYLLKHR